MEDLDTLARDFRFGSRGKSSAQPDRRPIEDLSFSDVFGGPAKFTPSSNSNNNEKMSDLDYDSIFNSSARKTNSNSSKASSIPVYDTPVYDVSKSKLASSTVRFDNEDFDGLLGNLGRNEKREKENLRSNSVKSSSRGKGFDDLLAGFGSGISAASNRPAPESNRGSISVGGAKHKSVQNDPFVVLESSSGHQSRSPGLFTDQLEKIRSPRSETPRSATTGEQKAKSSSFRYSKSNMEKKIPVDNFHEPPLYDMPNVSRGFQKSFGHTASTSPKYFETSPRVDMSPTSSGHQFDDVWLTVSEIPLFTQPTAAPPPSRPPPPIPCQASRSESGYFSSSSRKKGNGLSSLSNFSQHSDSPKLARPAAMERPVSQFDDLGDFAAARSQNSIDERANSCSGEETNAFSAASASAAAMKEAMDKAEAKFRHARELREKGHAKASRSKDDQNEENEQKRLQRESEREKARQAVERANREARERAAAEARLKNERAAVERANSEARERAGRVAVQRAQAGARERAGLEVKERAEKAAAAEEREKELRDKDAKAKAEDARRRAERAAVERAAAEARERAATAAAKMNQQGNDDDLESFFGMGRSSSAAKRQANSTNPVFDQQFQNKGVTEAAKRTSSSSGASFNVKRASSTTTISDDLSSIFGEFQEVEGETEERRRARLDRHQRTQERTVKALAEKNQRDLQAQMEQEERHRIGGTLDIEIKRWAAGKEGNLRALLSTLQYVLWPECGWQPVSLTGLIIGASVKKAYRKATLCIHPDKVQQKGATLQQKYIAEKVFDLLKEAWNKFNSEELF
ncbi:hypothetical protein CASFOL_002902 [Castilleja foliolosa]|uniref:J domain-containing protein n=1 Tax=Castilleja foliolosa TaxID=1961234 RepID=A0ABD3EGB4_9LAMI